MLTYGAKWWGYSFDGVYQKRCDSFFILPILDDEMARQCFVG